MNTAVHFMGDENPEILIAIGSLTTEKTPKAMSSGNRHVLKQTLAALVADRAVVGVIEHQQFDDVFSKGDRLFIGRRNHHSILSVDHTAHLDALERTLHKFHCAHPACPNRPQGLMVAETRDHDAEPLCCLNDLGPRRDLYLVIVDNQLGHRLPLVRWLPM